MTQHKVKVKLVNRDYTGNLRGYHFTNGVSDEEVPIRFALMLGASFGNGAVTVPDGIVLNPNTYWREVKKETKPEPPKSLQDPNAEKKKKRKKGDKTKVYTAEELEKIADKDGIEGLREIGDALGVKDRSILGLMQEIITAQEKAGK